MIKSLKKSVLIQKLIVSSTSENEKAIHVYYRVHSTEDTKLTQEITSVAHLLAHSDIVYIILMASKGA